MAAEKTLDDLFYDGLKDIYYAERKIVKALPKMARGAQSPDLKAAFEKHRDESETQVERLQQVFEIIGKRAVGKNCPAIDGIIEEGEEILDEYKNMPALDAGLIGAAQAVEHYEIARYGTLKRWAQMLGMDDAADLLDQTLQEESKTDEALTALADASANLKAKQGSKEDSKQNGAAKSSSAAAKKSSPAKSTGSKAGGSKSSGSGSKSSSAKSK